MGHRSGSVARRTATVVGDQLARVLDPEQFVRRRASVHDRTGDGSGRPSARSSGGRLDEALKPIASSRDEQRTDRPLFAASSAVHRQHLRVRLRPWWGAAAFESAGGSAGSDGGLQVQDRARAVKVDEAGGQVALVAPHPAEAVEGATHPTVVGPHRGLQAGQGTLQAGAGARPRPVAGACGPPRLRTGSAGRARQDRCLP
jgi:hypothetical protein